MKHLWLFVVSFVRGLLKNRPDKAAQKEMRADSDNFSVYTLSPLLHITKPGYSCVSCPHEGSATCFDIDFREPREISDTFPFARTNA